MADLHIVELLLLTITVVTSVACWRLRGRMRFLQVELEAAQRQRRRDALELSQRSALDSLKDEFVATVSHELRTPLTSIRGALGLLSAGLMGTVDARAQNLLRIALTNTDRLVRLINDILDLERMESGQAPLQFRRCSLPELVQQAIDTMTSMAEEAQVKVDTGAMPEEALSSVFFDADPDRILQVLTNLLSNAIKFSPSGSTVVIEIETPRDRLLLKVVDQGRGIPEEQLETIFERFAQVDASDARRRGGTGLGLTICRKIVQQHGGAIWIEPNPEQGVTVCVSLPRQQRSADLRANVLAGASLRPIEGAIVLCDAREGHRAEVAEQLRGLGHMVLEAGSGEEAMGIAEEWSPANPVQAVLLDIHTLDQRNWELARGSAAGRIPLVIFSVQHPGESTGRDRLRSWLQLPFFKEERLLAELGHGLRSGGRPGYVLLVEDDQELSSLVLAGFDKTEIQVDHASTQQEAIAFCQRRKPDLMILDLTLSDGAGFSLAEWLSSQPAMQALPLVVYSGRATSAEERSRLRSEPAKFLNRATVQTSDLEELLLALAQQRRHRRATDFRPRIARLPVA
ncbi:MAG TPA: ATP-binding protein [Granulicella sp.]|jgi:signal transduction histidine kinase/CheY-like chemotaxis protein|nr:ATP-binding protein [Granulicella sp.]